jgi:uncharacterized protein YodC (DUF2158 family)
VNCKSCKWYIPPIDPKHRVFEDDETGSAEYRLERMGRCKRTCWSNGVSTRTKAFSDMWSASLAIEPSFGCVMFEEAEKSNG